MINSKTSSLLLSAALLLPFSSIVNAWTVNANFENQKPGDKCKGLASTESRIVANQGANGSNACKQSINAKETGFGKWGGIINLPTKLSNGDELWIRVRTFMPKGFNYNSTTGGNRLKFLRVKTMTTSGGNVGYNDWYINPSSNKTPFSFIYEGRQDLAWNHVGTNKDKIKLGQWETYEYYIKFDTRSVKEGGTGRMRAWKNGNLMSDMTDRVTLKNSDNIASALYIFTYWNGGSPKSQNMLIDDIVVTNQKPSNRDKSGNPYIGAGSLSAAPPIAAPLPPSLD